MKKKALLLFGVLVLCLADSVAPLTAAGTAELDNEARILVQKKLLQKKRQGYAVESMDTFIKYSLFNIGGITATNVVLKDPSIVHAFEVVAGDVDVTLGRIAPQGNASHVIIIRPIKYGYVHNFTSAVVTYSSGENTQEVHTMHSDEPDDMYITSLKEFERKFSPHFVDWAAFAVMSVPPLLIPFMLWHSSKAKYEAVFIPKKGK